MCSSFCVNSVYIFVESGLHVSPVIWIKIVIQCDLYLKFCWNKLARFFMGKPGQKFTRPERLDFTKKESNFRWFFFKFLLFFEKEICKTPRFSEKLPEFAQSGSIRKKIWQAYARTYCGIYRGIHSSLPFFNKFFIVLDKLQNVINFPNIYREI